MPNSQEVDDQKQLDEPNECLGRNVGRRTARSVPGISHDEMIPISGTFQVIVVIADDAPVPDRPEPGDGGIQPAIRLGQAGDPSLEDDHSARRSSRTSGRTPRLTTPSRPSWVS